jgi:hypothetical protein
VVIRKQLRRRKEKRRSKRNRKRKKRNPTSGLQKKSEAMLKRF